MSRHFHVTGCLLRVWLVCLLFSTVALAQTDELQSWANGKASGERALGEVSTTGTGDTTAIGTTPRVTGQYAVSGRTGRSPLAATNNSGNLQPPDNPQLTTRPVVPNEFQKFIAESTGTLLPVFGSDFFAAATNYSPNQATPIPNNYTLGPGDELLIRGWGSIDIDYRAVIDRDGLINIPKIGTISLAGVRASNVEDVLRVAISKVYRGFNLNVTTGQLRGITIYVVGQARRPGAYTVSSLSTLISALFESGGPNQNGSLRHVQVKRAGKVMAKVDLYSFLAKGDKSADIKLMDGDVVVIPPAKGYIALTGKVETPAIFEWSSHDDSIESLLEVAGGMPILADPRRVIIEHIDPYRKQPRIVEELQLDAVGLKKKLNSGDLISVLPIETEFENAVTLRVKNGRMTKNDRAFRLPFRVGMKVTDIIPDRATLLSRTAAIRQNNFAHELGDQYDEFNWDYAVVERLNRGNLAVSLVAFNLGSALANPTGIDNIALQAGDTITVFSADDVRLPISKRRIFVRVEGEVKRPGVYQVAPGETIVNLLTNAGGVTPDAYLFGTEFYRESVRKSQQENLDKLIRRLEQQSFSDAGRLVANQSVLDAQPSDNRVARQAESQKIFIDSMRNIKPSGRMGLGGTYKDDSFVQWPDLRLENGDRLVVPNRPDFVQVTGAVSSEAAITWYPGKSISDYLAQAGITRDADKDAAFVIRANGSVLSNSDRWLSSIAGLEAVPGDIIVIPEKLDKEGYWTTFTRNAKDFTQIFYQLGLGAAAIKTLK